MQSDQSTQPESLIAAIMLSRVPGLGPRLTTVLLDRFGSAGAVLQQPREILLQINGLGPAVADRIVQSDRCDALQYLKRCSESGVDLYQSCDEQYPALLLEIIDSPALLHCRGSVLAQDQLAIGIVGSRRCTAYGIQNAGRLAGALVRAGFTVVSGLARGIDAAAHRGALAANGRTIAVLATGVESIYPPEHSELALHIADHGALVSECPLDQKPRRGLFPQRNRIISGMCQGVIIVEATRKSGALHTARHAMEQGREVFAVPGPVESLTSEGCHDLIRDGVSLIRNVDDVLDQLGPLATPAKTDAERTVHHPREMVLNPQESEILNAITTTGTPIDDVVRATQLDPSRVLATLTVLEMRRFIQRLPGNMVIRT
ncbi:MAG: DNA-processing protein DprA [Fuerstiella sp.]|nr:DNA-processing protein DprA [Fuerstiella sp.]